MPITGTRMRLYACLSVRYSKVYLECYRLCRRILMRSRGNRSVYAAFSLTTTYQLRCFSLRMSNCFAEMIVYFLEMTHVKAISHLTTFYLDKT